MLFSEPKEKNFRQSYRSSLREIPLNCKTLRSSERNKHLPMMSTVQQKKKQRSKRSILRIGLKLSRILISKKNKFRALEIKKKMMKKYESKTIEVDKSFIAPIDEDVIVSHLLTRFPAKSLFKFKTVCKSWCNLISNPTFALDQSRNFTAVSGLFYKVKVSGKQGFISMHQNSAGVPDPSVSFLGITQEIVASSNGLLCCRRRLFGDRKFKICNPVMMEWTVVKSPKLFRYIGLAFDPSDVTQGYKLVCPYMIKDIPENDDDEGKGSQGDYGEYQFKIFSSATGLWRESEEKILVMKDGWSSNGAVFVGGILYWMVKDSVLSFDAIRDIAHVIPLPKYQIGSCKSYRKRIGEWKGSLSCIVIAEKVELQIWVLRDMDWSKKYCVQLDAIVIENAEIYRSFTRNYKKSKITEKNTEDKKEMKRREALQLVRRYNVWPLPSQGDDFIFLWICRKVFSYDLRTSKLTELYKSDSTKKHIFYPYTNNLASLPKESEVHIACK